MILSLMFWYLESHANAVISYITFTSPSSPCSEMLPLILKYVVIVHMFTLFRRMDHNILTGAIPTELTYIGSLLVVYVYPILKPYFEAKSSSFRCSELFGIMYMIFKSVIYSFIAMVEDHSEKLSVISQCSSYIHERVMCTELICFFCWSCSKLSYNNLTGVIPRFASSVSTLYVQLLIYICQCSFKRFIFLIVDDAVICPSTTLPEDPLCSEARLVSSMVTPITNLNAGPDTTCYRQSALFCFLNFYDSPHICCYEVTLDCNPWTLTSLLWFLQFSR